MTVDFGSPSGTPVLTDNLGATYYYAGDENGAEVPDSSASPKYGTVVGTVIVAYTGSISDQGQIADLWDQIGEAVKVVITDTSRSSYTGTGAQSGKTQVPSSGGLKFWDDDDFQTKWADGAATVTFTFDKANQSFSNNSSTIGSFTLYYGAKGVEDTLQYDTDYYEATATVSKYVAPQQG